jgi:excisionase family DNA binding protein
VEGRTYYVYTLSHPTGEIFYIGKGSGPRIDHHEVHATRSSEVVEKQGLNAEKCRVIREIWAQGEEVEKKIVYETDVERDAYIYEWGLINMVYASAGLTNLKGGGQGRITRPKKAKRNLPSELPSNSYFLLEEVATRYRIGLATIRRLCPDEKIPGAKQIGRQWRIPRSFLEDQVDVDKLDQNK